MCEREFHIFYIIPNFYGIKIEQHEKENNGMSFSDNVELPDLFCSMRHLKKEHLYKIHFPLYDSRQMAILCRNLISLAVIFEFYRSTEKTTLLYYTSNKRTLCF
ncbi:Uncharacterized protein XB16_2246 [Leptospira santarosai]|uniref:Uncharacterized protein n=1 Tax=Leptospira santarosai TaxID=28183 RepID=A0A2P1QUI8_9LEPT|nr:Uncharacterized protein XB16_2246 [Leptospira santarosai]